MVTRFNERPGQDLSILDSPSPELKMVLAQHNATAPSYMHYIDYYEGRHNLTFATIKWRNAFGGLFRQFADNLCAPIVDAAADRLKVTGFTVEGDDDATSELWKVWTTTKMPQKAGTIHEHTLKVGDAYAIVWPDINGTPVISPNPAHQVCVYYGDDGTTIQGASKLWPQADGRWRLNLYYPNSIEKYITIGPVNGMPTKPQGFKMYREDGGIWPMPNPYGVVPVFHFANKPEMGVWGESELFNIIPLQDALNKSVADMLVAMEYVSLPQRWVTGLELDEDPLTGKPRVPFESGVDRVWSAESTDSRFGQFDAANFQHFTNVQNDFRLEMARISRTPLHYLSLGGASQGAFVSSVLPSGESLKTAEAPFTAKLQDRQVDLGDTWEQVMAFVARILEIPIDQTEIDTQWSDPAPPSIKDDLEAADYKINKLGIPHEVVWAELGYNDTQITMMKRAMVERVNAQTNLVAADTLVTPTKPPVQTGGSNGRSQTNQN